MGRQASRGGQGFPRVDRRSRQNRQLRSREGRRGAGALHPYERRPHQEEPAERRQAGAHGRRFLLVDRGDEATGDVAGRDRQGEAGPAVRESATLSIRAALAIEADILAGRLAPEARLGIVETAARYRVGATPVREALSRLAARGLVHAEGRRGFRVTPISRADLADIVLIRQVIEREAV